MSDLKHIIRTLPPEAVPDLTRALIGEILRRAAVLPDSKLAELFSELPELAARASMAAPAFGARGDDPPPAIPPPPPPRVKTARGPHGLPSTETPALEQPKPDGAA